MGIDLAEQPRLENLAVDGPVSALSSPGSRFPVDAVVAGDMNGAAGLVVKRKRGRPPKNGGRVALPPPAAKKIKEEEDVCFICFDGGSLVLCDRRDCPKAYHPACVRRDESFFNERVKWNCGWHLCNSCQRNALFMCYMCPYSLCKTCVKQADISCVRGSKGFCKTCMATVSLIENIPQGNDKVQVKVDFDDTASWEYLFKVYWVYLKQKESLTLDELKQATNPWKSPMLDPVDSSPGENHNTCVNSATEFNGTVDLSGPHNNQVDNNVSKRRKTRKQPPLHNSSRERLFADKPQEAARDWASQELLEFVAHVKNGDASKLTQFDVQALLLEYIRKNKLRDPHRKCQIICDKRLEILFGKELVGHFEMLKLLEYHFRDGSCSSGVVQAAAANSCASRMKAEERAEEVRQHKNDRQINLDKYAAIDVHNMNLIYLRRGLMENLVENAQKFHDKAVGSIVRIRISGNDQKQEIYRLVRVVGTSRAAEPYTIGDKKTHIVLKILNLDKIEDVTLDAASNQDFSEDECRRLRQSIKCGLTERMTVGEVYEKAIALQEVRIKDVLEAEILKLNHLRDRASEMGHRKELKECVGKLELLKSPEELKRRTREIPEVHADPRMDPGYQSDEDSERSDAKQVRVDGNMTPVHASSTPKSNDRIDPQGGDIPRGARAKLPRNSRTTPVRSQVSREEDASRSHGSSQSLLDTDAKQDGNMTPVHASSTPRSKDRIDPQSGDIPCGARAKLPRNSRTQEDASRSHESSQSLLDTDAARILEELRNQVDPCRATGRNGDNATLANHPPDASDASVTSSSQLALSPEDAELERIWHYRDPAGKVQGPFCMLQLRKWNFSGYFPIDLRIWRVDESQDKSLLLTDALSNRWGSDHRVHSDPIQPQDTSFVHGRHRGININAAWTDGEPNDACNSEMTNAVKCSDVQKFGQEPDLNNGPKLSSEENQKSSHIDTVFATTDQNREPPRSDLPSPTPRAENPGSDLLNLPNKPQLDREAAAKSQAEETKVSVVHSQPVPSFIPEQQNMPSQTPDLNNEEPRPQVTEAKEPVPSFFPEPHSSAVWPALSSEIGFHMPLSSENQNSQGIVWHDGPIELSTLGDESVSDLLSEVEALESLNGAVSPNSRIDFGDESIDLPTNDCFGRFVGLTAAGDLQFHSQPTLTEPPQPPQPPQPPYSVKPDFASAPQDFLSLTCASLQMHSPPTSLSLSSLSPLSAPPAGRVADAPLPPPPPPPPPPDRSSPAEEGELEPTGLSLELSVQAPAAHSPKHPFPRAKHGLETSPPSYNPGSARPSWATTQGTALTLSGQIDQWNRMSQQSVYTGGGGGRHSGQRERSHHHSVDPGIMKGGRPSWQRQPSFGGSAGGGGGSGMVQGHRGQRVCKFYESGYCKKGASCKYLHP